MAFIDYISYDDASDDLKKIYEQLGGAGRSPANIIRIAGQNPKILGAHVGFYRAIQHGQSSLTRHQREMIAVVVSAINHCHY